MFRFPGGIYYRLLMDKIGDEGGTGGGGSQDPDPSPNPDDKTGNAPGGPDATKKPDENEPAPGEMENSNWDEKTKDYIQSLRKENAKYRTSAKDSGDRLTTLETQSQERDKMLKKAFGIEDEEVSIEDKFNDSQVQNGDLQYKNEVLNLALNNGITGGDVEYFEFLISKGVNSLEEGQELGEEDLEKIISKVKGQSKGASGGSTSVNGQGKGNADPSPSAGGDSLGVKDFVKMNFTQKGELFGKNPDLYKRLNAEAVANGTL